MNSAFAGTGQRTTFSIIFVASALVIFLMTGLLAGCGPDTTEPPAGWEADEERWWRADVDTNVAFRNLESLEAMGVDESEQAEELAAIRQDASDIGLQEVQFAYVIKQRLLPIYRNHPEKVDSLFLADVFPRIEQLTLQQNVTEQADEFQQRAYSIIRENFREPRTRLRLGEDVHITYPDSLREQDIGGRVQTQVYINEIGEPVAVELLEAIHPTLDRIAMHATTEMRWEAARVQRNGEWEEIPSWARFAVRFATQ